MYIKPSADQSVKDFTIQYRVNKTVPISLSAYKAMWIFPRQTQLCMNLKPSSA